MMTPLCEIAFGSVGTSRCCIDKGPGGHLYTPTYHRLFEPLRQKPVRLLEIGIATGNSLWMWYDYFPQGTIVGLDVDLKGLQVDGLRTNPRIKLVLGDQGNPPDLAKCVTLAGGAFDIIIDDGSHTMHHQISSLQRLWNSVAPGGMYCIEDLQTSYVSWGWLERKEYADYGYGVDGQEQSTVEFLKRLVDAVNVRGRLLTADKARQIPLVASATDWERTIASIQFYPYLSVLTKMP